MRRRPWHAHKTQHQVVLNIAYNRVCVCDRISDARTIIKDHNAKMLCRAAVVSKGKRRQCKNSEDDDIGVAEEAK